MKKVFSILIILVFVLKVHSQCYTIFREMKVQPPKIPAGYNAIYNECPGEFYYVTHVKTDGSNTNTIYHIWNGKSWTTLNNTLVSGNAMKLISWNNRIIGFGNLTSIDGLDAPNGKTIRFAEYKNGKWDTLAGGNFDKLDKRQLVAYGTATGLYYGYTYDSVGYAYRPGKFFSYNETNKQFNKILDFETIEDAVTIMSGDRRLLISNIFYYRNGKKNGDFCYIIGDSITYTKYEFGFGWTYSVSCIDGTDDKIYGVGTDVRMMQPPVYEYEDNLIRTRYTSEFLGSEKLLGHKGALVIPFYTSSSSRYFSLLCKGEKYWMQISLSKYTYPGLDELQASKQGFFIQDTKSGKVLELVPGSRIKASVYVDINKNCQYDVGTDSILKYAKVLANSKYFKASGTTGVKGDCEIIVPNDTFEIRSDFSDNSCPLSKVLANVMDTTYNVKIPVPNPIGYDLGISVRGRNSARWNSNQYYDITITNKLLPTDSAWFEFEIDPQLKLLPQQDTRITSIKNNVVKGVLYKLGYYDKRSIVVGVCVDTTIKIGTKICSKFSAQLFRNETDSYNNKQPYCQKVLYSYDPNRIECNKDTILPTPINELTYRIDFQNEGGAEAIDVKLSNFIPSEFSMNTFQVIEASHGYTMDIFGRNLFVFFKDINLLPKSQSEELSMGYIIYKVSTIQKMKDSGRILNYADIYFDLNKRITTNSSIVTIQKKEQGSGLESVNTNGQLSLYPNPATSALHINTGSIAEPLFIYNLQGELVYEGELAGDVYTIDISSWSSGLYFARCGNLNIKFVKAE